MVMSMSIKAGLKRRSSITALVCWTLYDWANSAFPTVITTFIFSTYFTQAIAADPIKGTQQWGFTMAFSGVIIAILSPILGAIADQTGRRKPWIALFSVLTIISTALLWFSKPSTDYIQWTLTCVILGTIGFEVATVFYNAMMHGLVSDKYLGRLSGWAWGVGYAGGLTCLLVAFYILQSDVEWGGSGNSEAMLVRFSGPLVALWFLLFSLPLYFGVPDQSKVGVGLKQAIYKGIGTFFQNIVTLRHHKQIWIFLLANMLYIDGLNTIFTFGGIYAAAEFGFKPKDIILFGLMMNVSAGIGAGVFGIIDDYLGSKKTILISVCCLMIFLSSILLIHSVFWFWILAALLALFVGPVQAASRTLVAHIAPATHMTKVFGLFALSGKATAFLGPWLVGLLTLSFASQRVGMSVILLFFLVGGLLLLFIKMPKNIEGDQ